MPLFTKEPDAERPSPGPAEYATTLPDHPIEWQPLTVAADLVSEVPRTAHESTSLAELIQLVRGERRGAVPVVDGDQRLCGIVTEHDVVLRGHDLEKPTTAITAMDVMTLHPHHVRADDAIDDLILLMQRHGLRWVPGVDDDQRVVGLISLGDVASRADHDPGMQAILARAGARRSLWRRLFH